jgi:hypothetical protein
MAFRQLRSASALFREQIMTDRGVEDWLAIHTLLGFELYLVRQFSEENWGAYLFFKKVRATAFANWYQLSFRRSPRRNNSSRE